MIKYILTKQGFTHVGITPAAKTEDAKSSLNQWIENNYHGTMAWMSRRKEERGDIFEYFPEAKSVVSVGMNYFKGRAEGDAKISNYAWGDDYHDVLKNKLHNTLKELKKIEPNILARVCVDTSPVMEKTWAQKAGIGWIGKHTNLITKDYGSWIFLGEIIMNIDLEYDKEFEEDLCGTCTACLDACPVDAFPKPYQIDAAKCISYITIEYRGKFNDEINNHDWIYGCDICQEVCPWNQKFEAQSDLEEFNKREALKEKKLNSWTELTQDEFRSIFAKSAVKRTKYSGFKRNIDLLMSTNAKFMKEKTNP